MDKIFKPFGSTRLLFSVGAFVIYFLANHFGASPEFLSGLQRLTEIIVPTYVVGRSVTGFASKKYKPEDKKPKPKSKPKRNSKSQAKVNAESKG